jgi:hypothetical protein
VHPAAEENAMAETLTLTITLTKEQQLQVLVTTGLVVTTLELPVEARADGGEALARVPLPDCLKQKVPRADRTEVSENG